ncbi:hypothetical protein TNCV_933841 [Trichonephila clavipes]|nr:hypothetical protein TNCV_933841 [Trichonephila clavipes]
MEPIFRSCQFSNLTYSVGNEYRPLFSTNYPRKNCRRIGQNSKQSFNDGWLLILAEASKTGLIFIEDVADVSLMTGQCGR